MSTTTEMDDVLQSPLLAALAELMPAPEAALAKARVRGRVMAAAREQLEPQPSPLLRPAALAAAAASAVVALGSGGAIGASASALPGEPLYSVKLAVEELKSTVVTASGDPVAQVVLAEERATQRVTEVEALASRGKPIPPGIAEAANTHALAAATAAANVPQARLAEVTEKRETAHAQRQETLSRVLTQVPPPAQTAIADAIARQEQRQDQRDERQEQRQDQREERRDERTDNSGPGNRNDSNSSPGNNNPGNDNRGRSAAPAIAPLPTRTPEPTPHPRPRTPDTRQSGGSSNASSSRNPGRGVADTDTPERGNAGSASSGRGPAGNAAGGNGSSGRRE